MIERGKKRKTTGKGFKDKEGEKRAGARKRRGSWEAYGGKGKRNI